MLTHDFFVSFYFNEQQSTFYVPIENMLGRLILICGKLESLQPSQTSSHATAPARRSGFHCRFHLEHYKLLFSILLVLFLIYFVY